MNLFAISDTRFPIFETLLVFFDHQHSLRIHQAFQKWLGHKTHFSQSGLIRARGSARDGAAMPVDTTSGTKARDCFDIGVRWLQCSPNAASKNIASPDGNRGERSPSAFHGALLRQQCEIARAMRGRISLI
jgi:hypothetical protein